jgi:hypothetical protein
MTTTSTPQPNGKRRGETDTGSAASESKRVHLIHHGKSTVTVPAVKREVIVSDENDPDYGNVREIEVEPSYEIKGELPKGTKFGRYRVGVAHEITDPIEEKALRARGFEDATPAEVEESTKAGSSSVDAIAKRERERAAINYQTLTTGRRPRAAIENTEKTDTEKTPRG